MGSEMCIRDSISASPEVRAELVEFFGHPDAPYATKQKPKDWAKVQAELEQLKKAAPPEVTGEGDGPTSSVHFSSVNFVLLSTGVVCAASTIHGNC